MRAPLRGCWLHRHVLNAFFNYAAASRAQSKERSCGGGGGEISGAAVLQAE